MPEVGIAFQTDKSPGTYARLAARAEAAGFDVVSVFGDLWYQPPLPALLEIAGATSRVRLGAACLNPYTQHPYELAGATAALAHASGGRAYLGLARGTWLAGIGVAQPHPIDHLRDTVAIVRALLSGDDDGYAGRAFELPAGARLRYPLPSPLPRVLIGAWGPRLVALAGEVADEVKVGGSANPELVPVMRARVAVGAAAAGRPVTDVGLVFGAVTVVDEDGRAARRRAREEVAMYLAVVADLDPTVTLPPGLLDTVRRHVDAGEAAAAGRLIADDVLDRFAFAGTPEQVAGQARRLLAAGAARVEFGTPHGRTDEEGVELLGRRVLPMLRE